MAQDFQVFYPQGNISVNPVDATLTDREVERYASGDKGATPLGQLKRSNYNSISRVSLL
jgi:hypothetical protein